jgi:hypothetical protein
MLPNAAGQWFSPGTPVFSTNKTDRHNITEIAWKVALNTTTISLLDKNISERFPKNYNLILQLSPRNL